MEYRKELNGLRALAVIAVIIYHVQITTAGFQLFPGGFFGVDVFFVLSGFLITGIIRHSMDNEVFSFRLFYWRRAKRIIPALLVVLIGATIAASQIFLPEKFIEYAASLKAALYFGSNHFFYNEDAYTAAESIHKPLLHLWSLAVEWQFYVIYPVILWFVYKYFKKYSLLILFIFAISSLLLAYMSVSSHPNFAFYLLPTRVWEFLFGGLITYVNRESLFNNASKIASYLRKAISQLSLLAIIYSFLMIDHNASHPSIITLLPVVGTCLYILFSHKGDVVTDILSLKAIVFIGLISYSLYLWHIPIFVFYRYLEQDHIQLQHGIVLIIISMSLATITYRLVEKPFRDDAHRLLKIGISVFSAISLAYYSYTIVVKNGIPARFGELSSVFQNINGVGLHVQDGRACQHRKFTDKCHFHYSSDSTPAPIILIGDSNAGTLASNINQQAKQSNRDFIQVSSAGCITLPTIERKVYEHYQQLGRTPQIRIKEADDICSENGSQIRPLVEKYKDVTLIYHIHRWRMGADVMPTVKSTQDGIPGEIMAKELSDLAAISRDLVLVYPIPLGLSKIPEELLKMKKKKEIEDRLKDKLSFSTKYEDNEEQQKYLYRVLDSVKGNNVHRVYPSDVLCENGTCFTHNDTEIYYADRHHLSIHGAKLVVDSFENKLRRLPHSEN